MMRKSFYRASVCRSVPLFLGSALFGCSLQAQITIPGATADSRNQSRRAEDFFAAPEVRVFQIELPAAAMNSLRQEKRLYVSGTVREGNQVFRNVGIRLKGIASFQPLDQKPSLVLKFDACRPSQEFCGLTKLMLNNSAQDSTYLSELLATRLFRDAGVPAARVTHARVTLNGRDLGLYVAIEAMNKRFLKHQFKSSQGNLYEGYVGDIYTKLEQDSGQKSSQNDVRALLAACQTPDLSQRFLQLSKLLDVDRFASFAAVEMLISHWDGYTLHTNNYRLYHDPSSGEMVFIPHGLDSTFRSPNLSIQPPMNSLVSRALFQTPQGQELYQKRLKALHTNVFRLETLTNRIEEALARLRRAGLPGDQLHIIERQATLMGSRVARRLARFGDALSGKGPTPLEFDHAGVAGLRGWREEFDHGDPVFERVTDHNMTLLHIQAQGGRCRASWRTLICLQPGLYRFEGRIRTDGVVGNGAGLRISGDPNNLRLTGRNDWQTLQHEFRVEDRAGEVDLVCECDASAGEVWFDLDSLRVRKLWIK